MLATLVLAILIIAFMLTCCFLVVVVLMQEGKGGGLSGMISGQSPLSDTLGAYAAEATLKKWTRAAAVGFMVLAILLTVLGPKLQGGGRGIETELSDQAPAPAQQQGTGTEQAPAE